MKETSSEKSYINFSTPDPVNSIVSVFKVSPDGSMETIGKIYPYYLPEEGCVEYTAFDLDSQQIFPSSTNFTEIESQFIQYSKELSETAFIEEMQKEAQKPNKRKEALRNIRNLKITKVQIIKSY